MNAFESSVIADLATLKEAVRRIEGAYCARLDEHEAKIEALEGAQQAREVAEARSFRQVLAVSAGSGGLLVAVVEGLRQILK